MRTQASISTPNPPQILTPKMPQPKPNPSQNGAKKTLPRTQANTKTLQPKAPPQLRREEAFIHEEASDTEDDSESDVEEEMRHDVDVNQHKCEQPKREHHLYNIPSRSERGQYLCDAMDSNRKTGTVQPATWLSNRCGDKNINHLLYARFKRDHDCLDQHGSAMDVEKDLLHHERDVPDSQRR